MGIRERFARFFQKQADSVHALFVSPPQASFTTYDYAKLANEGYGKNVHVFAAIRLIANSFASVRWQLIRTDPSGDEEEIRAHPLLTLMERPNPLTPRNKFFEEVLSFLYIGGASFVFKAQAGGKTRELWTVRPDLVTVKTGTILEPIKEYEIDLGNGRIQKRPPEETLYLRFFNPSGQFQGLSPIKIAGSTVDQANESLKWNVSLLQNQANPSGVLKVKGKLTEPEFTNLREQINDAYAGAKNSRKPLVLEGDLDYQPTGMSPTDMDWLEGQKETGRNIAIALGVQPELLGDSSNKTYSNYGEARKAFYEETVIPLVNWIAGEFSNFLCREYGTDLSFRPDIDSIEAMQEDRDKLYSRIENSSFITINEKRLATGYDEIDGGDKLLIPLSLIPFGGGSNETPVSESETQGEMDGASEAASQSKQKAFNLTTDESKTAYWKSFDSRRMAWEKRVAGHAENMLRQDVRDAAKAYGSGFNQEDAMGRMEQALKDRRQEWEKFYLGTYVTVGTDVAKRVYGALKSCGPSEIKADIRDLWLDLVSDYVRKSAGEKIVGITTTTMKSVRSAIDAGLDKGEGINQIAARIDALRLDPIIPYRSEVIARTETISASNLGSQAAAKSTGLPLKKEWIATRDDRVRDDHLAADGQKVEIDNPYRVGGEELMFPGDSTHGASPENTIQCRCTEAYVSIGSEE